MKKIVLVIMLSAFTFILIGAEKFTYVGTKICAMCHKGPSKGMVWEKWQASSHAKSLASLAAKCEDKNPVCLGCHTTAFKNGGYEIGAANAANFAHVGCEVCHGPGSAYKSISIMKDKKQALLNGLIIPNENTCRQCHNSKSPTFKGFNYQEALKKIDHKIAAK